MDHAVSNAFNRGYGCIYIMLSNLLINKYGNAQNIATRENVIS